MDGTRTLEGDPCLSEELPVTTPVLPGTAADTAPHLADETIALVRRWLAEAASHPRRASRPQRLAGVLRDPKGLDVHRRASSTASSAPRTPASPRATSRALAPLVPGVPARHRCGAPCASAASPAPDRPGRRRADRAHGRCARWSGHLIVDATRRASSARAIRALSATACASTSTCSARPCSARRRPRAGSRARRGCSRRDDVDYVSIKVSSTVAPALPVGLRRGGRRDRRSA